MVIADTRTKEVSLLGSAFFGLTPEYMEQVYQQIFLMIMKTNFTFLELYSFPIYLRDWFSERLVKYYEEINKSD